MEPKITNKRDITYLSELILDIFNRLFRSKMSRIKFADDLRSTTYVTLFRKSSAHLK